MEYIKLTSEQFKTIEKTYLQQREVLTFDEAKRYVEAEDSFFKSKIDPHVMPIIRGRKRYYKRFELDAWMKGEI